MNFIIEIMKEHGTLIVPLWFLSFSALGVYAKYLQAKHSDTGLIKAGQKLGLRYLDDNRVLEEVGQLAFFQEGLGGYVDLAMQDTVNDVNITLGRYNFSKFNAKSSGTCYCQRFFCLIHCNDFHLPYFTLTAPEEDSLFTSSKGITFQLSSGRTSAFSKHWTLLGEDEPEIRRLFNQKARAHFCKMVKRWRYDLEGDAKHLLLFMGIPKPKHLNMILEEALALADLWRAR